MTNGTKYEGSLHLEQKKTARNRRASFLGAIETGGISYSIPFIAQRVGHCCFVC